MPFFFTKGKAYSIDYEDLKTELLKIVKGPIFNSAAISYKYLNAWITRLKVVDEMSIEQMDINRDLYEEVINKYRIFSQDIKLGKQTIKIHFNGELFAEGARRNKPATTKISYKDFEGSPSYYTWSHPNDGQKSNSKEPILTVPFKGAGGAYLVIDGNHRVAEAIKNKKDLDVYTINLFDENARLALFTSVFDEMFFNFYFDMACLSIDKEENPHITDDLLITKSFVSGNSIDYEK